MFRKAVSTLEGVKAGRNSAGVDREQADIRRCGVQLSATIQPCRCRLHVADELHSQS